MLEPSPYLFYTEILPDLLFCLFGCLSKTMYRYEKNMYLKSVLVFLAPTSSNDNSLDQMEQILY